MESQSAGHGGGRSHDWTIIGQCQDGGAKVSLSGLCRVKVSLSGLCRVKVSLSGLCRVKVSLNE